ncbi:hypothetical protein ACFL4W_04265 [Planctomycetota bacterium]
MKFRVIGRIESQKTIAAGNGIREIGRLRKVYGPGKWRKKKGTGTIQLANGETVKAELHWYELHGKAKKELKIKNLILE